MATLPGARVISVASWRADEDNPVFPLGSQPKTLLLCPEEGIDQGLIPGHRYLFKNPSNWQRMQIWSEILHTRLAAFAESKCQEHFQPSMLMEISVFLLSFFTVSSSDLGRSDLYMVRIFWTG